MRVRTGELAPHSPPQDLEFGTGAALFVHLNFISGENFPPVQIKTQARQRENSSPKVGREFKWDSVPLKLK